MSNIINMTASEARKNLYKLIDQVVTHNTTVRVHKKNAQYPVLITRANPVESIDKQEQLEIVAKTAGALKSSGYIKDEMKRAAEIFLEEYND